MTKKITVNADLWLANLLKELRKNYMESTFVSFCNKTGQSSSSESAKAHYASLGLLVGQLNAIGVDELKVFAPNSMSVGVDAGSDDEPTVEELLTALNVRVQAQFSPRLTADKSRLWSILRTDLQKISAFFEVYLK